MSMRALMATFVIALIGCGRSSGQTGNTDATSDGGVDEGTSDTHSDADVDDEDDWSFVGTGCMPDIYPQDTYRCNRGPVCPEGIRYCCSTILCGGIEIGEWGCCEELYCGTGDAINYSCIEAIGDSLIQLCTRPEPEYRCPEDKPFCCHGGAASPAVCADHELHNWTCESHW